jgi:hypothetical protein
MDPVQTPSWLGKPFSEATSTVGHYHYALAGQERSCVQLPASVSHCPTGEARAHFPHATLVDPTILARERNVILAASSKLGARCDGGQSISARGSLEAFQKLGFGSKQFFSSTLLGLEGGEALAGEPALAAGSFKIFLQLASHRSDRGGLGIACQADLPNKVIRPLVLCAGAQGRA